MTLEGDGTKRAIPTAKITAAHIRAAVDAVVARDGIEALTISHVARVFGVTNNVITNRLRQHFTDWLAATYPEHSASVPIKNTRAALDIAMKIAREHGLSAVTPRAMADDSGMSAPLVLHYIGSQAAIRSRVIHEALAQGGNPELVAAGILLNDPAVAALDIEAKRAIWRDTGIAMFGPSEPNNDLNKRTSTDAAGANAK